MCDEGAYHELYVKNKIPQKLRSKGVTSYNPCHIESRSGPVIKVSDESSFDEESDKISQPWLEKSAPSKLSFIPAR
jgi:hypothetical protein